MINRLEKLIVIADYVCSLEKYVPLFTNEAYQNGTSGGLNSLVSILGRGLSNLNVTNAFSGTPLQARNAISNIASIAEAHLRNSTLVREVEWWLSPNIKPGEGDLSSLADSMVIQRMGIGYDNGIITNNNPVYTIQRVLNKIVPDEKDDYFEMLLKSGGSVVNTGVKYHGLKMYYLGLANTGTIRYKDEMISVYSDAAVAANTETTRSVTFSNQFTSVGALKFNNAMIYPGEGITIKSITQDGMRIQFGRKISSIIWNTSTSMTIIYEIATAQTADTPHNLFNLSYDSVEHFGSYSQGIIGPKPAYALKCSALEYVYKEINEAAPQVRSELFALVANAFVTAKPSFYYMYSGASEITQLVNFNATNISTCDSLKAVIDSITADEGNSVSVDGLRSAIFNWFAVTLLVASVAAKKRNTYG